MENRLTIIDANQISSTTEHLIWAAAGIFFIWCLYDVRAALKKWIDDDDDDDGGDPDKPKTPFGIDPQEDPGDWWKHEK